MSELALMRTPGAAAVLRTAWESRRARVLEISQDEKNCQRPAREQTAPISACYASGRTRETEPHASRDGILVRRASVNPVYDGRIRSNDQFQDAQTHRAFAVRFTAFGGRVRPISRQSARTVTPTKFTDSRGHLWQREECSSPMAPDDRDSLTRGPTAPRPTRSSHLLRVRGSEWSREASTLTAMAAQVRTKHPSRACRSFQFGPPSRCCAGKHLRGLGELSEELYIRPNSRHRAHDYVTKARAMQPHQQHHEVSGS